MKYIFLLILILVANLPDQVNATDETEVKSIYKLYIINNTDFTSSLSEYITKLSKDTNSSCQSDINIKRLNPEVITKARFITDIPPSELVKQHPYFGQWIEKAIVTDCGQKNQMNVLTIAFDNKTLPNYYPLLNGRTKIEPTYQLRAEKEVMTAIPAVEQCSSKSMSKVLTTVFLGYRDRNSNKLTKDNNFFGWFEQWNVKKCDQIYNVNLAILPDSQKKFRFIPQLKSE